MKSAGAAISYGRPPEIEDLTNRYLIHPLSKALLGLSIRLGISPNQVSILGALCALAAAFAFYRLPDPVMVATGLALMVAWHVLDGLDGRLARATGTSSPLGRIIDGICDYLAFSSVYVALTLNLTSSGRGREVWGLALAAIVSHGIQAAGYEERRQQYQRRCSRKRREDDEKSLVEFGGKASILARIYDYTQRLAAGPNTGLDDALERSWASARARDTAWRERAFAENVRIVRLWSILNANNRTLAISVYCFLGSPALYFFYEIFVLNAVFVGLIWAQFRWEKATLRATPLHRPALSTGVT